MVIHYRINAGYIPAQHWVHDPVVGGGRIIGEGCHFVDFLSFLVGSAPAAVTAQALPDLGRYRQDNVVMTLRFTDGSLGTIDYLANGDKALPKERVEVFCGGRVAVLDDFRALELVNDGRRVKVTNPLGQDKGHRAGWQAFLDSLRAGGAPPISYEEINGVHRAVFTAADLLASGDTAMKSIG